jgi:hypothetical protein
MNEDKYNNQTDGQFFLKRTKQGLPRIILRYPDNNDYCSGISPVSIN